LALLIGKHLVTEGIRAGNHVAHERDDHAPIIEHIGDLAVCVRLKDIALEAIQDVGLATFVPTDPALVGLRELPDQAVVKLESLEPIWDLLVLQQVMQ
jgi:hypothetical protein